jgi:hypothetical protein
MWKIITVFARCILTAFGGAVGLVIGGSLIRALNVTQPTLPPGTDASQLLLLSLGSAFGISLILAPVASRLRVPVLERAAVLFLPLWAIQGPISAGEGYFFTTYGGQGSQLITTAASSLALSLGLAVLFPPKAVDRRLMSELRAWFATRTAWSWSWRVVAAGALYLPAYWLFGLLAYSIVHPYYENTALGLGLRVPTAEIIVPLEIIRGIAFVVVLLPLTALVDRPRWSLAGWLWLVIALLSGWAPLLTAAFLPAEVRLVHGTEITLDSLAQAVAIAVLLARSDSYYVAGSPRAIGQVVAPTEHSVSSA